MATRSKARRDGSFNAISRVDWLLFAFRVDLHRAPHLAMGRLRELVDEGEKIAALYRGYEPQWLRIGRAILSGGDRV